MREPEGYLIYLIKQVELGVRRPFEELLAAKGISTPTYTALTVLRRWPGITSSELARRSFVRAQTMAETVNAMLDSGLLRREKDPAHGRQMLLYITAEGDRMIDRVRDDVQDLDAVLASALSEEDRRQLIHHLRACRDVLLAREGRVRV
ncbi:MarR family winged helix-turn-helix transcriptional regulator [Naasia aerilata]|nr:MarR family winged helix-turn-helix transcriptional regulator [Naasia aerilata]